MPLDRRARRLLDMLAATGGAPDARSSVADRRASLVELAAMADDVSTPVRTEDRAIAEGPAGPIDRSGSIRRSKLQRRACRPALVFFHGGGWVAGGLETHDGLCRRLCEASGAGSGGRRLPPGAEHPFPAGLMDCLMAVNWVAHHALGLRIDPARLAIAGDSAGGGLAAAVTQIGCDAGGPRLALQALICPILDVGRRTGSRSAFGEGYFVDRAAFAQDLADYAGRRRRPDDPRLSPLWATTWTACRAR